MRLAIVVWEAAPLGNLNDGFLVPVPTARGGGVLKLWLETSRFRTVRFDYQRFALAGYGRPHGPEFDGTAPRTDRGHSGQPDSRPNISF